MKSRKQDSKLVRPNVYVGKFKTSVSLEPIMWQALHEIAAHQGKSVHDIITEIDRDRAFNLSTTIRVYIVEFYRARIRL
jgi:predicted DNA-binding ribbon-helix-helix protein